MVNTEILYSKSWQLFSVHTGQYAVKSVNILIFNDYESIKVFSNYPVLIIL